MIKTSGLLHMYVIETKAFIRTLAEAEIEQGKPSKNEGLLAFAIDRAKELNNFAETKKGEE